MEGHPSDGSGTDFRARVEADRSRGVVGRQFIWTDKAAAGSRHGAPNQKIQVVGHNVPGAASVDTDSSATESKYVAKAGVKSISTGMATGTVAAAPEHAMRIHSWGTEGTKGMQTGQKASAKPQFRKTATGTRVKGRVPDVPRDPIAWILHKARASSPLFSWAGKPRVSDTFIDGNLMSDLSSEQSSRHTRMARTDSTFSHGSNAFRKLEKPLVAAGKTYVQREERKVGNLGSTITVPGMSGSEAQISSDYVEFSGLNGGKRQQQLPQDPTQITRIQTRGSLTEPHVGGSGMKMRKTKVKDAAAHQQMSNVVGSRYESARMQREQFNEEPFIKVRSVQTGNKAFQQRPDVGVSPVLKTMQLHWEDTGFQTDDIQARKSHVTLSGGQKSEQPSTQKQLKSLNEQKGQFYSGTKQTTRATSASKQLMENSKPVVTEGFVMMPSTQHRQGPASYDSVSKLESHVPGDRLRSDGTQSVQQDASNTFEIGSFRVVRTRIPPNDPQMNNILSQSADGQVAGTGITHRTGQLTGQEVDLKKLQTSFGQKLKDNLFRSHEAITNQRAIKTDGQTAETKGIQLNTWRGPLPSQGTIISWNNPYLDPIVYLKPSSYQSRMNSQNMNKNGIIAKDPPVPSSTKEKSMIGDEQSNIISSKSIPNSVQCGPDSTLCLNHIKKVPVRAKNGEY